MKKVNIKTYIENKSVDFQQKLPVHIKLARGNPQALQTIRYTTTSFYNVTNYSCRSLYKPISNINV